MNFKRYIAAVFIVFSLAFSFSGVNLSPNQKTAVVFIIGSENNNFTKDFLKNNEDLKKQINRTLSIKIFLINSVSDNVYFNSS